MKKLSQQKTRNNRGVSIIVLVFIFAILLLTIDFFLFNLAQISMVERQITAVSEAASLAGTSILTRLDTANDDVAHKKLANAQRVACRCASNMVLRGHILGQEISKKAICVDDVSNLGKNLKADFCQYTITLSDPENNYAPVEFGNPRGRTVSCYITYGYKPSFVYLIKDACYAVSGNCASGLPQIDSVLVLDLSASMDDQTAVTFVRREWIHSQLGLGSFGMGNLTANSFSSGPAGIIQYVSLLCPSAPHTIANYLGWNADAKLSTANDDDEVVDGSLVNVLPPQNLDKANNEPHGAVTHPMYFDAYLRSHYSHYDGRSNFSKWEAAPSPYCRALDYGTPPGNCDLSVGLGGNGDAATDMLGNIATPLGPGIHLGPGMNLGPGRNNANPAYRGPMVAVATAPIPAINAFSDTTWQNNGSEYFGYQPAAPGGKQAVALNDPIPSPDQQTFTDLVVNIVNPDIASRSAKSGNGNFRSLSGNFEQPIVGPDYFVGFSYTFPADDPDPLLRNQNFNFPNIGVVVEAARGNLENTVVLPNGLKNAQAALIDRPVSVDGAIFDMRSIQLKDGYQRAYQRLAMLVTQPLASVLSAMDHGFFQKLHKFADCRFGLVSFSSAGSLLPEDASKMCTFGTLNDKSVQYSNARSFYIFSPPYDNPALVNPVYDCGIPMLSGLNDQALQDGAGFGFRIPRTALDVNAEHYLECISENKLKEGGVNTLLNFSSGANGIYNCRAESTTDSGEALKTAYNMFHSISYDLKDSSKNRPSSKKLIIFFTDGEPTGGIKGNEAQTMLRIAGSETGSRSANTCEGDGVAVFTIGLNLNKGKAFDKLKKHQLMLFADKEKQLGLDQAVGIASRASHGGRYYACENLSQLKPAFLDITRRFTQSQH